MNKLALLPLLAGLGLGLTGCSPATSTASEPAAVSADLTNGRAVFLRVCSVCHQSTGLGIPNAFPPLAGSPIVDGDPTRLIRIVLNGLQGPVEVNGKTFNSIMPPQGAALSDKDIADVLSFVRTSWGHDAPAIAVSAVAKLRAQGRTTSWTWAELNQP